MLCFKAHTTRILQPSDKTFIKSLNSNFNKASSVWLRTNLGETIKQTTSSELLRITYPKSVCMDIALNGFRSTSLWSSNRNLFRDVGYFSTTLLEVEVSSYPTEENVHLNINQVWYLFQQLQLPL